MAIGPDFADIAAEQWGLITTAQARTIGGTPQEMAKLCDKGILERLTHGVYRLFGVAPDPLDEVRAAWLATDPGRRASERLRDSDPVVVSHRSAASIYGLGDLEADTIEFSSSDRRRSRREDVQFHRLSLRADEWRVVDGLPVTTVLRTIQDLAAAHIDGGHLASVVRDALTEQEVDADQLAQVLAPYARRYGARMGDGEAVLRRFLQEAGVSAPIGRAVDLAHPSNLEVKLPRSARDGNLSAGEAAQLTRTVTDSLRGIVEAQQAITQQMETVQLSTEALASIKALTDVVRQIQTPKWATDSPTIRAAERVSKAIADSPTVRAAERASKAIADSPTVRAAERMSKAIAPVSEAARRATEKYAEDRGTSQGSGEGAGDPDTD